MNDTSEFRDLFRVTFLQSAGFVINFGLILAALYHIIGA